MKVALLTLTRGAVSGGYAKYLQEMVPRLFDHPEIEELRVYVPPAMATRDSRYRTWPVSGLTAARRWLRREIGAWRPDVVFVPSSVHIDFGDVPVVTMVRNMEPLDHPFGGNRWSERGRNAVRAVLARWACRRSSRVIAVSEHVREALVERWRVDASRIAVVPHGVDASERTVRPGVVPPGRPFIFSAGSIRPARGLEDLLAARDAVPDNCLIVIAGGVEDEAYAGRLRAAQEDDARVVWSGRLSAEEMGWCLHAARAFVMTSRAEACPNTVLEALAHGALSVSTDQPPMPEFFGDAALYYRRRDGDDLTRALREALELDARAADDFRRRAVERSRQFTWDRTVDATIRELKLAVR